MDKYLQIIASASLFRGIANRKQIEFYIFCLVNF